MQQQIRYPWWVGLLTFLLACGSILMTSWGSWLVATGWDWEAAYVLIGVLAICNVGSIALGYVGAENWMQGAKMAAFTALVCGLIVACLSGIGTMRALTNMFEQNKDALRVETRTEASADKSLERAVARVERAHKGVAPLEAQAAVAQKEFERESASGFGDRATQRKTEWDDVLAKLTAARAEVTAAEEHLAQVEAKSGPVERSDAALVAGKTSETEQWLTIWLGTGAIELLPMLSGWLFGIRVAAMADPMAALNDRLGDLDRRLAKMDAKPLAQPAAAPKPTTREEADQASYQRTVAGMAALGAKREAIEATRPDEIPVVEGEDDGAPEWMRRKQTGDAKQVKAPLGVAKAPPRRPRGPVRPPLRAVGDK